MTNQIDKKLTVAENIELIRKIFFRNQTSELKLVDLKSLEVSNRDGNEDEEKNKELADIFKNLLEYCLMGLTPQDFVELHDIDEVKHNGGHQIMQSFDATPGNNMGINSAQGIVNKYRNVLKSFSYFDAENQKDDIVSYIDSYSFEDRVTALITIAFYANKAEKMRIAHYSATGNRTLSIKDRDVIDAYRRILYDIKQECVRQAIVALTTDSQARYSENEKGIPNGNTFSWAIDEDNDLNEKNRIRADSKERYYVFSFLDEAQLIPFSFHIPPKKCKTFSTAILDKIYAGEYSISKIADERIAVALKYLYGKQLIEENRALKPAERKIVLEVLKKVQDGRIQVKKYRARNKDEIIAIKDQRKMIEYMLSKAIGLEYEDSKKGNSGYTGLRMGKLALEIDFNLSAQSQEAVRLKKKTIEDIKKSNGIVETQHGENLDLHASIATLQYYFDTVEPETGIKIRRVKMEKDKPSGKYPAIDAGYLTGSSNINGNTDKPVNINADQKKGQRSAVSILAEMGFYVPRMLIKYADTVITGEKILNPFEGCSLAREVPTEKLFEYAEARKPENGSYLMESTLNEEQLKYFNLYDFALERRKHIEYAMDLISKNSFCVVDENGNKKKIAVVPEFLYNGSNIAYTLGYDCYISITPYQRDKSKSTFSITVNPNSKDKDGENLLIPEEVVSNLDSKIAVYNQDESTGQRQRRKIFVLPNRKLASVGGPKYPGLYADLSAEGIRKVITKDLIEDKEQRQLVEQKLGSLINKKNAITGREIFEASKSALRDIRLIDETQEAIRKGINDEKNIEEK